GHIVFVTDAFWPEVGGVERVCVELARALVRRGARMTVIARRVDGRPDDEELDGIRIRRFAYSARPTPAVWATSAVSAARRLVEVARRDRPDVAHMHLAMSAQGPLSILRPRGIPLVASFYGRWDREFEAEIDDVTLTPGRMIYYDAMMAAQRVMQRRLLARADRVVALSDYSLSQALSLAPGIGPKLRKIPGGVDPARFRPAGFASPGAKPTTIATVRRLVQRMGVDLLIEALPEVAREFPDVRLVIAGRGPLESALAESARALAIRERIEFRGYVADDDLTEVYRDCDLFVVPTRAQENFGLPVLEAAACGAGVLATNVGSLPEILTLAGSDISCVESEPASIAAGIVSALRERHAPSWRERRRCEAERILRDLSWDAVAGRYMELYRESRECAWR
ncbi:MAG: glycosyltransferase family 4 protein, partial [Deltaproteobacteria bacterium]|nr:glycosyltransferase family 4 protein [Deltaproteobacteria bacterium]